MKAEPAEVIVVPDEGPTSHQENDGSASQTSMPPGTNGQPARTASTGQPARSPHGAQTVVHGAAQQSASTPSGQDPEDEVDASSAKGIFGWTTIDDVNIPFMFREGVKYLSVRMVELKLLNKYPNVYPKELETRPPLASYYLTTAECKLLNEINMEHCQCEYGTKKFVTSDLIVKLVDFEEFYRIVKGAFPQDVLSKMPKVRQHAVDGGWLQLNNTVVPYVQQREARTGVVGDKYIPLQVVRYAAGLLVDMDVQGRPPSPDEATLLNGECSSAGLNFVFTKDTELISLAFVIQNSQVKVTELPKFDPFGHAQYREDLEGVSQGLDNGVSSQAAHVAPMSIPVNRPAIRSTVPQVNGMLPPGACFPPVQNQATTPNAAAAAAAAGQFAMLQQNGYVPNNMSAMNRQPSHSFAASAANNKQMQQQQQQQQQRFMQQQVAVQRQTNPQYSHQLMQQRLMRPPTMQRGVVPNAGQPGPGISRTIPPPPPLTRASIPQRMQQQQQQQVPNQLQTNNSNMYNKNIGGATSKQYPASMSNNNIQNENALARMQHRIQQEQYYLQQKQYKDYMKKSGQGAPEGNTNARSPSLHALEQMSLPNAQSWGGPNMQVAPQSQQAGYAGKASGMQGGATAGMYPNQGMRGVQPQAQQRFMQGNQKTMQGMPANYSQSQGFSNTGVNPSTMSALQNQQRQQLLQLQQQQQKLANINTAASYSTLNQHPTQRSPYPNTSAMQNIQQQQQQQPRSMPSPQQNTNVMYHKTLASTGTLPTGYVKVGNALQPMASPTGVSQAAMSQPKTNFNPACSQSVMNKLRALAQPSASPQQQTNVVVPAVITNAPVPTSVTKTAISTSQANMLQCIKSLLVGGKSISCIETEARPKPHVLVEAAGHVFFPSCPLHEFQYALETVLKVPMITLSIDEEKAFIEFYGLKAKALKCNKAMQVDIFEQHIPQMSFMFKEKEAKKSAAAAVDSDVVFVPSHLAEGQEGGAGTSEMPNGVVKRSAETSDSPSKRQRPSDDPSNVICID